MVSQGCPTYTVRFTPLAEHFHNYRLDSPESRTVRFSPWEFQFSPATFLLNYDFQMAAFTSPNLLSVLSSEKQHSNVDAGKTLTKTL